jgi:hypothetical protein
VNEHDEKTCALTHEPTQNLPKKQRPNQKTDKKLYFRSCIKTFQKPHQQQQKQPVNNKDLPMHPCEFDILTSFY